MEFLAALWLPVLLSAVFVFSGIIYGLVTAGTFAWLWPAA